MRKLEEQRDVERRPVRRHLGLLLGGPVLLVGLYFLGRANYPLMHSIVEIACITVAWGLAGFAWNTRRHLRNDALVWLGVGYLFVGLVDLLHTLAYQGMGTFDFEEPTNVPVQLWILARWLEAAALVGFPLLHGRRWPAWGSLGVFAALAAVGLLSIFQWKFFPVCFVPGDGLTFFKIGSEFVTAGVVGLGGVAVWRLRASLGKDIALPIVVSVGFTIGSAAAFTLYDDMYGVSNFVGHVLKVISFVFIYEALMRAGLTRPQALLARELRESEERHRVAMESTAEGVWDFDLATGELTENGAVARFLGLDEAPPVGAAWGERVHPEDLPRLERALQGHLSANDARWEESFRLAHRDGSWVWVEVRGRVVQRTPDGAPRRVVGTCVDISDRRMSEELLRGAASTVTDLLYRWELGNDAVEWFGDVHGALGYDRGALPKTMKGWLSFVHPDDRGRLADIVKSCRRGAESLVFEYRVRTAGGDWRWWSNRAVPARAGRRTVWVGACQDITSSREREAEIRHSQKMKAVGQLAAGVAHDFNNLLQAIGGFSELAREELAAGEDISEYLTDIEGACASAADLTRQLLAFSRKAPIQLERLSVREVVESVERRVWPLLPENVSFSVRHGRGTVALYVDRAHVENALLHLCLNGRDAMPDGGHLEVGWQVEPNSDDEDAAGTVVIGVSDTGVGIDDQLRDRVFEPFFTTKEPGQGPGLGLAMVYAVAERHGGRVSFESEPGYGTSFRVELPAVESVLTPVAEEAVTDARPSGGTETVLLAEDDDLVRDLAATTLARAGYHTVAARDGEEALELIERRGATIDIAILDVVMPRLGGVEVYQALARKQRNIPVIFVSGYGSSDAMGRGVPEDASLLCKPFSPAALLQRVREALDAE